MDFGIIYHEPARLHETNIGDDIQSLGVMNAVRSIYGEEANFIFLSREHLNSYQSSRPLLTIMQGWFMNSPNSWPPHKSIVPLFLGFHISPGFKKFLLKNPEKIDYFKIHGPVGCRDEGTLSFLKKYGVDAYFSGCMSIFQECPSDIPKNNNLLFLVDASHVLPYIEGFKPSNVVLLSHIIGGDSFLERLDTAKKLIRIYYSRAHTVITTRLHCALPCAALGIPVIFIRKSFFDYRLDLTKFYINNTFFCPNLSFLPKNVRKIFYRFLIPNQLLTKAVKVDLSEKKLFLLESLKERIDSLQEYHKI